ncbi:MAG TPA: ATP-grasp domain-containing protein [Thermoanaerobaculia bacterium]|nr:ATP-grasp domain-containing protein [Thermoanaerobaculia bacterium]
MQRSPPGRGVPPLDLVLLYSATSGIRSGLPTDSLPDVDDAAMAPEVEVFRGLGHQVRLLGITYDTLPELERLTADFVFNYCDGTGLDGNPGTEVIVALERRGLRFSGAGSWCYWLTNDKWGSKLALAAAGVPVPAGWVATDPEAPLPAALAFPLIVKPRDGFGSLGVDAASVVHDAAAARGAIERIVGACHTDALVERYVEGREVTVGLLGPAERPWVLPPLEVQFGSAYRDLPRIRMFATKHDTESELYWGFRTVCPAPLPPAVTRRVQQVARRAYRAVGGDGYARVDMRLAADGTPYVLEVNANCSLETGEEPQDCGMLPLAAGGMGWSYPELLARLLAAGLKRPPATRQAPLAARWREGEATVHALADRRAGERLLAIAAADAADATEVLRDPAVRYLAHAPAPNLRLVADGDGLWLAAARRIRAGDVLTLDRSRAPSQLAAAAVRARRRAGLRRR